MISFMISVVPPKIDCTAESPELTIGPETAGSCSRRSSQLGFEWQMGDELAAGLLVVWVPAESLPGVSDDAGVSSG
jgi:hypothetical protein